MMHSIMILMNSAHLSRIMRKPAFCIYAKTKVQLISAFVIATQIVQPLYFLNLKFQDSSPLRLIHKLVCVRPGRKPFPCHAGHFIFNVHVLMELMHIFFYFQFDETPMISQ